MAGALLFPNDDNNDEEDPRADKAHVREGVRY
jgi:hypothetical protein